MESHLSRLVYLATNFRPPVPTNRIMKLIGQGDLITAIARAGFAGAIADYGISETQLNNLYEDGGVPATGSVDEFKTLIVTVAQSELDVAKEDMKQADYLSLQKELHDYMKGTEVNLIESQDFSFADTSDTELEELPKFNTGFTPFDSLVGGFYQGIVVILAPPGTGKTSLMLSMAEAIRRNNEASNIWFLELEIPGRMLRYRTNEMRRRTMFKPEDRMTTGIRSMREIFERLSEDPDPDRIIFIDSPDVMAGGGGSPEGRRFVFEDIYRDLLRVKEQCKMVVVASQPKQADVQQLSLTSLSESWHKAQYADMIIGANRLRGTDDRGFSQVRLRNIKNRFGPSDTELMFRYNYANLLWETTPQLDTEPDSDW